MSFCNKFSNYFKNESTEKISKVVTTSSKIVVTLGLYYVSNTNKEFYQWGFDSDDKTLQRRGGKYKCGVFNEIEDECETYNVALNRIIKYADENEIKKVVVKCDKEVYDFFVNNIYRNKPNNDRQLAQFQTRNVRVKQLGIELIYSIKEN